MKYLPTFVLLDLAEEVNYMAGKYLGNKHKVVAQSKLASIDTELLSRMPEGEFMTVYDYTHTEGDLAYFTEFLPVGFESECYTRLAEAQAELLDADYATDQLIGLDLGV